MELGAGWESRQESVVSWQEARKMKRLKVEEKRGENEGRWEREKETC
jgi:hypothetical protein